jgi:YidC/Oxa1 family membrane protein insertase
MKAGMIPFNKEVRFKLQSTNSVIKRSQTLRAFVVVAALVLSVATAYAQSASLPAPPALAIANGLIARHDYAGAVKKLNDIVTSRTYKDTPWAPEALYQQAHVEVDLIHNKTAGMLAYNNLVNNQDYDSIDYPQKALVPIERLALEKRIDVANSSDFRYKFIDFFVRLTGSKTYSYWLALVFISIAVRLLVTPLTITQYKSMKEMQRLQPLLKELQAKYKDKKEELGPKTMELYKEHGVNPAAGCVPLLLQMPVLWFIYQCVQKYQYHFSAGTFLWIGSPLHKLFPAFVAENLSQQDMVLLLLYAVSMYVTQRMMPATDPAQAEMQKTTALMTAAMFFIFFQNYHYPSAFILYWLISNILSTATQMYFMRRGDTTPAGTVVVMPPDGDTGPHSGGGSSRNGGPVLLGPSNGSTRTMRSVQGTQRGVISPKIYPKKKRR